jgi:hypothetical protein
MDDREQAIKELIPDLEISSETLQQDGNGAHYEVTLTTMDCCATFPFFKGSGHNGVRPELTEVLYCLLQDSMVPEMFDSVEQVMNEYGYEDYMKAQEVYRLCEQIAEDLERLDLLRYKEKLFTIFEDY